MSNQIDLQSGIAKLKTDLENISVMAKGTSEKCTSLQSEKDENLVEKELLMLQIQQLQEELELYYLQSQKYKSELDIVTEKADTDSQVARAKIHSLTSMPVHISHNSTLKLMLLGDKFSRISGLDSSVS